MKHKPFHVLLFSLYPTLFLFFHNKEQMLLENIFAPLILLTVIIMIGYLLLSFLLRNAQKAAILTSILTFFFFSYGRIYTLIYQLGYEHSLGRQRVLFPIWCLLILVSIALVLKLVKDYEKVTKFLNVVSVVLIGMMVFQITSYELTSLKEPAKNMEKQVAQSGQSREAQPNIYYIILDGYANPKVLKEIFEYDNSKILNFLEEKGFYVAEDSHSNYAQTQLSLSSSLNMEYLNDLAEIVGEDSSDKRIPIRKLDFNNVARFLKSKGYSFVHFSRGFGAGNRNLYSDVEIQCGNFPLLFGGNEFVMLLIQTSMLSLVEGKLIGDDMRERITCAFDKLADVPSFKGPSFVFAHILCPHPPYLFDASGNPVKNATIAMEGAVWKEKRFYLDQVKFVNMKLTEMITKILASDETDPIIIIQSDHGTASRGEWDNPSKEFLWERMMIFNALRLPGNGREKLYQDMTPVNTFRILLNHYFDADYELLEEKSYYSPYEKPYKFKDITKELRKEIEAR